MQLGGAGIDAAEGDVLEPFQDFDAGSRRAAQGQDVVEGLLVGADGRRRRWGDTRIREVEFCFHAFIANPIAIGPGYVGVG